MELPLLPPAEPELISTPPVLDIAPAKPRNYTGLVGMAGYTAWVKDLLHPDNASKMFEGYAECLAAIAQRREAMRLADIAGFTGKTAGWSPSRNVKMEFEMPYVAALLFKAAFGLDALQQPRVKKLIRENHPEFCFNIRR